MKRKIFIICLVCLISISSYGCTLDKPSTSQNTATGENSNINENVKLFNGDKNNEKEEDKKKATLYFGNRDATGVVGEIREIDSNGTKQDFIKQVVKELIKGSHNIKLTQTIPEEANVLSVRLEDNIAYVDFSKEIQTKHWGGTAGEFITINSIVNTLTEFNYIDKVKITVEGNPINLGHREYNEPIKRNEEAISQ